MFKDLLSAASQVKEKTLTAQNLTRFQLSAHFSFIIFSEKLNMLFCKLSIGLYCKGTKHLVSSHASCINISKLNNDFTLDQTAGTFI